MVDGSNVNQSGCDLPIEIEFFFDRETSLISLQCTVKLSFQAVNIAQVVERCANFPFIANNLIHRTTALVVLYGSLKITFRPVNKTKVVEYVGHSWQIL